MARVLDAACVRKGPTPSVWLAVAPIPATLLGLTVAVGHGVAWTAYAPNIVALVVGTLLLVVARSTGQSRAETLVRVIPVVAAGTIAVSLFGDGVEGVHRWIALGPLHLNASEIFAPWLLLGFRSSRLRVRKAAAVVVVVAQVIHVVQPDAGQASALVAGALPLLAIPSSVTRRFGGVVASVALALCILAWLRRDPLAPVDHVERIFFLTAAKGAGWSMAAVVATAFLFVPFALRSCTLHLCLAPVLFLATMFAASFLGNFPVPVLGAGAGGVLAWYGLAAVFIAFPQPREATPPERERMR